MKTLLKISLALLACWIPAFARGESFQERRAACFDAVWADYQQTEKKLSPQNAFWRAEVLFEMGKVEEAKRLANRGLDQLVPGNKENRWIYGGNSGFVAWPGMDCYVRYQRFFDDALRERFRKIYTGAVFYKRLTTSNHTLMAAVTRCLATEVWGEAAFVPDPFFRQGKPLEPGARQGGTFFVTDDLSGVKFCRSRIAGALVGGPGEYASRPYGAENILPLLTLAECSRDPEIARTARAAYETSLAQLAPTYLHGHLATFSTRSYPDALTQQPWGVAGLTWMYFGGVTPSGRIGSQWGLRAMTSTYRVPEILERAGTDRTQPYVFRSLVNGWALSHFVNKSYALFSRSPKARHPKLLGQNYPCGVMWDEPDPSKCSFLWITCPAADDPTPGSKNNPNGIHTHGVMPFEQQAQFEDATLSVFNIPAEFRNPYVLGFLPGGWRAIINDAASTGRIFLNYGSVLIAISASQPFACDPAAGIRAPAGKIPPGGAEFRVVATRCAVALETASPQDFAGATAQEQLSAFRTAILKKSSVRIIAEGAPRGVYQDRSGHTLEVTFDGEDRVNGKPNDYARWPALECPWYSQDVGGQFIAKASQNHIP